MRAAWKRGLVATVAAGLLIAGTGSSDAASGPYAGATTFVTTVSDTGCAQRFTRWTGRLPSGKRIVTVAGGRGTFPFECSTGIGSGVLRATDTDGVEHEWQCGMRPVVNALRLTCSEPSKTGTYPVDLRGGGAGNPAEDVSDGFTVTGAQSYAMTG